MSRIVQPVDSPVDGGVIATSWLRDVYELAKPGIVKMVCITAGVGFALSALGRVWTPAEFAVLGAFCLLGTALSAAGANALNMAFEVRRDSAMDRTRSRPMPAGRMATAHGMLTGAALSLAGVLVLWLGTNPVAAMVSLATIVSYVLIYTPMKPLTPLATLVGAVPGALPPLIGWAAAGSGVWRGLDQPGGWTLFAIMFVWQVPHFLAIAWKYREDYAKGGHRVLPVLDPSGVRTAWASMVWAVALVPVSLAPVVAMPGRFSVLYLIVATIMGLMFVWTAVRFARTLSDRSARSMFLASIAYLPVVLLALVGDAVIVRLL